MVVLVCDNSSCRGGPWFIGDPLCATQPISSRPHPQQFIWVISLIDSCLETLWGGWQETNTVHKNGCAALSVTTRETFIFIDLRKTIDWGLIRQHMAHCVTPIVRAFIMKCKWRVMIYIVSRDLWCHHTQFWSNDCAYAQWPDASRCYGRNCLSHRHKSYWFLPQFTLRGLCSAIGFIMGYRRQINTPSNGHLFFFLCEIQCTSALSSRDLVAVL